jgi:hypothetical protein
MKNSIKNTLCSFYFCFLFLVIGTLVSCKSNSVPLSTKTEVTAITTEVIIRDTIFQTQKDSSYYKAWLECQNGIVVMKGAPIITPGKYLNPPKVIIEHNQLNVDCNAEAQRLFAKWKDTYIKENKQETITIPVPYEKPLNYWQVTQIWCGRAFMLLVVLFIIYLILKLKKNL